MSRRTLFAAFRAELGFGPYKFMELRRLNALRNRLLHADPEETTVACLSNEIGFSELGRTAVTYRKLFCEPPSASLRRSA
ncbi:MAG: helix-turn-helix domain-containing protein [Hyphomicrobiales bacterium]